MKKITLLSVVAALCLHASAQQANIRPLTVGDAIPPEILDMRHAVVNHPQGKTTITLADYKDKLVILDFWATWCSSCIKKLPTLYSLQKENEQRLKVILVNSKSTRDSHETIQRFLVQRKAAYNFSSIVQDSVLKQLFQHEAIPHYAWIKDNMVIAISNAEGITKENIEYALNGQQVNASTTLKVAFDPKKPIFENGNGGTPPAYIYKSILAPYVEGLGRRIYISQNEQQLIKKITITNSPLIDFYGYCYPVFANITPARTILNIAPPARFASDSLSPEWEKRNFYNYEATFPPCSKEKAMDILRADLDRFFGYHVTSVEKEMSCWVLNAINPMKATNFPQTIKRETNLFDETGLPIFFNNYPLPSLLHELERIYKQPFIDETRLGAPVMLSLPAQLLDSVKLQSSLADQGLSLTKENRKIQVVILSDK